MTSKITMQGIEHEHTPSLNMSRRHYLGALAVGVTIPLAGCMGDETDGVAEADTGTENDVATDGAEAESGPTAEESEPEPEPAVDAADVESRVGEIDDGIELLEHEFTKRPGMLFPYHVEGVLENVTDDTTFDYITVNVQFYNAAGQVIDDGLDMAKNIDPGQQVRFDAVSMIAEDEEPPAAYEVSVEASSY